MARHDEGFFSAKDNLRLFWESDLPEAEPRAHVLIAHGYQDHCGRYGNAVGALVQAGFASHAFDFRGHGQSDGRRGHCDSFSQYVDDLDLFVDRVRGQAKGKKLFLLGHSQGGLVAIHWLRRHGAGGLSGLVLSSPYLKLAFTPSPAKVLTAKLAGKAVPWLPVKSDLTVEALSRDVEVQRATARDPLYNRTVTPRWFNESNRAQKEALAWGPSIEVPVYVFLGAEDPVAAPAVSRQFFESLASRDKKFKEYPGMRHECMNELGKEEVLSDLLNWISSHL